jgi:mRNA-degrading endonuclease HigB of HigAB toxin-antitoxin module
MTESTEDVPKPEETQVVLNIKDLYKIGNEDVSLDISTTYYSNIAYVQVHSRDVYVDFMQIPGTIKGGTMTINATRIIMPVRV